MPMSEIPDSRAHHFQTVARIAQAGTLLSLAALSLLALRSGSWQLWATVAITLILFLLTDLSIFLARQGHVLLAPWLLFVSGELAFLAGGALVANMGWMLGLTLLALISSMSTLLLPRPQRLPAIGTALLTAILLLGLDALAPAYRLAVPTGIQVYLFVLFAIVGFSYLVYYAQVVNPSLRARLLAVLLALTLLPLGLVSFIALRTLENRLRENISFQLQAASRLSAQQVDEFIGSTLNSVKTYAQLPEVVEFLKTLPNDPERESMFRELQQTLVTLSRLDPVNIISYGVLDRSGTDVADSVFVNIGSSEADKDYFLQPLQTSQPYVSYVNARTNTLTFSAPVRDERGVVLGVLRVHYNAVVLQQLVVRNKELAGPASFAVLVDEDGIILAHGDNSAANFKLLAPVSPSAFESFQAIGRLSSGTMEQLSLNLPNLLPLLQKGTQELITSEIHPLALHPEVIVAQPLLNRPWTLFYAQQERFFSAPLRRQFLLFSVLALMTALASAFISLTLSERLLQPIALLTQAARRVQEGDFNVQVALERRDESGLLATAFNTMTAYIRDLVASLEARVAERTRELEERSRALQYTAEIGSAIASTLDPQQLARQAVELIQKRFGLYYVGLFEVDGSGEWAELRAGTGEAGQKMLARGHRIRIGTGMVGWSIANNQARIAQQAELDEVRLRTPELPETRSEAAIPLRSRGQVLGALSIQSDQPNAFTPENLAIFQILAEQLGTALDNAYLYTESQETLRSLERAYAERTRIEWREALRRLRAPLAFRSAARGSIPVAPLQASDASRALTTGEIVIETDLQSPGGRYFISVPIKIRGHVIGLMRTYKSAERGPWSEEEINALRIIAEQVGAALETARLYGDSQRRAERERLLAEITTKIRSVSDPQAMIQTTLDTLRQALGVKEVHLIPAETDDREDQA